MNQIAISVKGVSKKYSIGKQKDGSLRGTLTSLFAGGKNSQEDFWALKNVSFDIRQGDVVGIVGKNGAGKSTLLKILSQITRPTTGEIELNGRVASLLEVGTGFHPELTGRENIFLNGTILGMTKKEVKAKFDEIVVFSGIEKFIDTPVKRYSSGMYVRLAFAVAAHLEPEILIIDEVLAVGDAEFQKKCLGKMKDVAGEGRTVIFVSHDLAAVKQLCNRGILVDKGKVLNEGTIEQIITQYLSVVSEESKYVPEKLKLNNDVCIRSIELLNQFNIEENIFKISEPIRIKFNFQINTEEHPYKIYLRIVNQLGQVVFSVENQVGKECLIVEIAPFFLVRGGYYLNGFIHNPKIIDIEQTGDICSFSVVDSESEFAVYGAFNYGVVLGNYKWIENEKT